MSLLRKLINRLRKAPQEPKRRRRLFLESLEVRDLMAIDIEVVKDGLTEITPGESISYSITVTNRGDEVSNGVTLIDEIPAGLEFSSFQQDSGPQFNEIQNGSTGTIIYTIGSMDPNPFGDNPDLIARFTLVLNVPTSQTAPFTNTAEVVTDPDDNPENNTSSVTTDVVQTFDLHMVSKEDSPADFVQAGQNITYTITLRNDGPSDAPTVQFLDTIPTNTTFVSFTSPGGWTRTDAVPVGGTGTIAAQKGMASGEEAVFTLVVRVNDSAPGNSVITNRARVFDDPLDNNPDNDFAEATTVVQAPAITDLVVDKVDLSDTVTAGNNLTYQITLSNIGSIPAQNVSLSDLIPPNTTFVSFAQVGASDFAITPPPVGSTGQPVTATIASFAGTATFQLVVRVLSSTPATTVITNTSSVTTTSAEPSTTNNTDSETTNVVTQADLRIVKRDAPDPVEAGGQLTYEIDVSTLGPSDAQSITFSDTLPANVELVSVTAPDASWLRTDSVPVGGSGTITFTRATLAAGTPTGTFTIVVNVPTGATGQLTNSAVVGSATQDPTLPNLASTVTTVASNIELEITKTDDRNFVVAGENNTYTITVNNTGTGAAQNVLLEDLLPPNTTLVSFATPAGWTRTDAVPVGGTGTVSATTASMAGGSTAVFTLVVLVGAGTPNGTSIQNQATISSSPVDNNTGNNTATDTSEVQPVIAPDIVVTKTDDPDPVIAGNQLTFTITVTNNSEATTGPLTLTDVVPAGTTFVSMTQTSGPTGPGFTITQPQVGGTGTVTATRSSLGPNQAATFELVVLVNPTATGTITNTASAPLAGDADSSNNSAQTTTTVQTRADIGVTKTDAPDPVSAGGTITYTINVRNFGPSAAPVQLLDAVPENTTFVSMTQVGASTFTINRPAVGGTGNVSASTASMAPGALATFQLVVRVNSEVLSGSSISNTATVSTSTNVDTNTANNTASETTFVVVPPDFGDAPASYGTLVLNDGARHNVSSALRLGANVDFESDGQPTTAANGDDVADVDDEDGVIMPLGVIPGRGAAAIVTASAAGRLDAWLDFNRNGTFDAGEKIADNLALDAGTSTIFFTVPDDASIGDTYARFRISTAGGLGPTGLAGDGEVEDYATRIFTINPGTIGIVPDPELPGQNMLLVLGSAGKDTISVTQLRTHKLKVQVNVNNRNRGQFPMADFRRIVVFAGAGNDTVNVGLARPAVLNGEEGNDRLTSAGGFDVLIGGPGNDTLSSGAGDDYLFGDEGNDSLNGGGGNDVLLGGIGRDSLSGSSGRDLLIGGFGVDTLGGGAGDDILIGGTTSHDVNRTALASIMAEWSSQAPFPTRVANLGSRLNVNTIQDDGARDRLDGNSERDWYLDYLLADNSAGFNAKQDRKN